MQSGWTGIIFLHTKKHCGMLFMRSHEDSVVKELLLLCVLRLYEALGLLYLLTGLKSAIDKEWPQK